MPLVYVFSCMHIYINIWLCLLCLLDQSCRHHRKVFLIQGPGSEPYPLEAHGSHGAALVSLDPFGAIGPIGPIEAIGPLDALGPVGLWSALGPIAPVGPIGPIERLRFPRIQQVKGGLPEFLRS